MTVGEDPQKVPPSGWRRPQLLGYPETLRGLGGIVAPLLTGFSLTTIAVLLTSTHRPPLSNWSVVALALAVVFFLYSMQVAFLALARSPLPSDFISWIPGIASDQDALATAQVEQRATFEEMARFWKRAGLSYDLGLDAFLAGFVLLLIPHTWSLPHTARVVIAGVALAGEFWWTAANRWHKIPHPVVRTSDKPSSKLEA